MTKAEKLQNEAKTYLEDRGFYETSRSEGGIYTASQSEGDISMQYLNFTAMTVHLDNDGKIRFQLDWDLFQNSHVSYGEKPFDMDSYASVPKRIKHVLNHTVIMLDMVAWSDIRADERSILRNTSIGHISIESFGSPLVYEDEDLVLKFALQDKGTFRRPVMAFRYFFEPFGDLFFTQMLGPRQKVVFIRDIRKMQDDILHWCALPYNPFKTFRDNWLLNDIKP